MNLRMIGLAAVAVLTALVPLAASAGPADSFRSGPELLFGVTENGTADVPGGAAGEIVNKAVNTSPTASTAPPESPKSPASPESRESGAEPDDATRTAERCGPAVVSPEGIEAQTCVLSVGPDTLGRTYYRNATGRELAAVLSLMGPRGRAVQTRCAIGTDDEPATCETPPEPSTGPRSDYLAMVEFAAPEQTGSGVDPSPLLLRSGSNSQGTAPR
jgi:hypothetical protein